MQKFIHAGDLGSDHCQRAAGMLACQSSFPLCDKCQSGHSYLASREDCERVSIVECEKEWTMARQYGIPLPNCTDLPEQLIGDHENHSDVVKTFMRLHTCICARKYHHYSYCITLSRVYHIFTYLQRIPNLASWEVRFQRFVCNCGTI